VATKYAREDHVHPLGPGGGGGASVTISVSPPGSPTAGNLWWESDTGNLYIYYNDGTSSQWVLAVPSVSAASLNALTYTPQNLAPADATQARKNVYAAPFDALAYNGMQINGSMEVSQEASGATVTGGTKFLADGWKLSTVGTQVMGGAQNTFALSGFKNSIQAFVSTANASPGAGDYCYINQTIEGYRTARLGWGTASAQSLTLAFWMYAVRPGNYSGVILGASNTRSYPFVITVNAASTWEYKTFTIPGCTDGTWITDNNSGMSVIITMMCGTTNQAPPNVWKNGLALGATGTINGVAATTDFILLTGVVVLPGIEAPSAARSALIMRPFDQELLTCQRYLYRRNYASNNIWIATLQAVSTNSNAGPLLDFPVQMRAVPTFTASAASTFGLAVAAGGMNALTGGTVTPTLDNAYATGMSTASGGYVAGNAVLFGTLAAGFHQFDARL
jgi:hypothetical protein